MIKCLDCEHYCKIVNYSGLVDIQCLKNTRIKMERWEDFDLSIKDCNQYSKKT
jgi:hypothetical protein